MGAFLSQFFLLREVILVGLSHGKSKTKPLFLRFSCILFSFLVILSGFPIQIHAALVEQVLENGSEIDQLSQICQGRKLWRQVVEALPQNYPDSSGNYGFWVGDLDGDGLEELIARVWTYDSTRTAGTERLLVYDTAETDGSWTSQLLFETAPPVPTRYGFLGSADGSGVIYAAITSSASGDCVEGTVKLNNDRTDLVYTETRAFSLAKDESVSQGATEIFGYYDTDNPENTDWGPLDLESMVDQDFTLGVDNNWFKHTISKDDARSGFYGVSSRQISLEQYASLIAGEPDGTIGEINEYLNRDFEGVCLGLTATIALAKEGKISLANLDPNAGTFFDLGKPSENKALFNQICHLHIAQNLLADQDYDCRVNCQNNPNLASELEQLVEKIRADGFQLVTYTTKNAGHAFLIKELTHFSDLGLYDIRFYDVNSLSDDTPNGRFFDLFVKDDFSSFVFTDANGETINQDNCYQLNLLSADTIWDRANKTGAERDEVVAWLSFSNTLDMITFEDGDGNAMKYDCTTGQITGFAHDIAVLPSIVNTLPGCSATGYTRLPIANSDTYTLTCAPEGVDMQINTGEQYFTLKGEGIETAVFSESDGIQLTGTDFTFTVSMVAGKGEDPVLYQVTGSGEGTIAFSETEDGIQIVSESPAHIDTMQAIQNMESVSYEIQQDAKAFTLTQNGVSASGVSALFWIALAFLLVFVLVVVGVLFLFHRRRQTQGKN